VRIEQRLANGTWKLVGTAKSYSASSSKPGFYTYTVKPTAKTTYRARYAGENAYLSKNSTSKSILPQVALSTPAFRTSTSGSPLTTLRSTRTYIVNGTLKPRHAAPRDKEVRLIAQRLVGGKVVQTRTIATTATNITGGSRYSAKVKLGKGTWRVRAHHPKDTLNALTYSSYRNVTVK
jgi:hypothetical protein